MQHPSPMLGQMDSGHSTTFASPFSPYNHLRENRQCTQCMPAQCSISVSGSLGFSQPAEEVSEVSEGLLLTDHDRGLETKSMDSGFYSWSTSQMFSVRAPRVTPDKTHILKASMPKP